MVTQPLRLRRLCSYRKVAIKVSFTQNTIRRPANVPTLWYRGATDEVAVDICTFVLWIFFVRRMQVILFYNVVYVYVCKIGEEKFGAWWWSFSWLGISNPVVWHPHCVCDCPNESTGPLFQSWSIQRVTKTVYWYCLSLYCCWNPCPTKHIPTHHNYCFRWSSY